MHSRIGIFFILLPSFLLSIGTLAGTKISNVAFLDYVIDGDSKQLTSNTIIDVVNQLIDVNTNSLDFNSTLVSIGDSDAVLKFSITNIGNGDDIFTLIADNNLSDEFDVSNIRIFLDDNNNSVFDISDVAISDINLSADASRTLFIVADIPNLGTLNEGDSAGVRLSATSTRGGSGVSGTIHIGTGVDGVDSVDSFDGGVDNTFGTYAITLIDLIVTKGATILNQFGTHEPITGAVVSYEVNISLSSSGIVNDVNFSDVISSDLTYFSNTLKLDGTSLSDADDLDSGSYNDLNKEIVVNIGDINDTNIHTVSFDAVIN